GWAVAGDSPEGAWARSGRASRVVLPAAQGGAPVLFDDHGPEVPFLDGRVVVAGGGRIHADVDEGPAARVDGAVRVVPRHVYRVVWEKRDSPALAGAVVLE